MKTVAEGWEDLAKKIGSEHHHPVQQQEMRRAFYAGASFLFNLLAGDATDLPEDDGLKLLSSINAELNEFGQRVQDGKA